MNKTDVFIHAMGMQSNITFCEETCIHKLGDSQRLASHVLDNMLTDLLSCPTFGQVIMAPKKRTSGGGEPKSKAAKKASEGITPIAADSMALPHLTIFQEWSLL